MLREPSPLDSQVTEDRASAHSSAPLRGTLPYLWRYPRLVGLAFISIGMASLTVLGIGTALRVFVDKGVLALPLFFAIVVFMAAASYGRLYWVSKLSERVTADLRLDVFACLLRQPVAFFEHTRVGELQSRLTTDTTLLQIVLSTSVPVGIRNVLIILGGLGMLLTTSPLLTGLTIGVTPLILIPLLLYGRKVREYSRTTQTKTAALSACLDETFSAIRTVFSFCREEYVRALFASEVASTYQASLQRIKARASLTAMVMILVFGAVSFILWYGSQSVARGEMTAGDLAAFLFYAVAVAGAAGSLSEIHGDILRAAGGTERIFALLKNAPGEAKAGAPLPRPLKGHIQFLDVSFAYPSRPDSPVLKGLNFEVAADEVLALSGPSGVGKTTIFNLLMRFYEPTSGQIFLDGTPLHELDIHALRDAIGLVPQDPYLFATTLFDNIRFGKLDATLEDVKAACKAAYADEFIDRLPDGYDTMVGERGVTLSGGQRQRIAIARAILKNPPILLLDEATSALDTESEKKIQQALASLHKGRTTLVIAHRPSTLKQASRVMEL